MGRGEREREEREDTINDILIFLSLIFSSLRYFTIALVLYTESKLCFQMRICVMASLGGRINIKVAAVLCEITLNSF